jgi:uncharacterized protein YndB with AHSA1/START domain
MNESPKTIQFKFERMIPAPTGEVFDAWLNPKVPGTTWHEADKLLLNPKVDGFFYWLIRGNAHYGRFTEVQRPARLQHTWMSRSTLGEESTVTVTFQQHGEGTLMTLVHSGIPDSDPGRGHEQGWNYFLGKFTEELGGAAHQRQ